MTWEDDDSGVYDADALRAEFRAHLYPNGGGVRHMAKDETILMADDWRLMKCQMDAARAWWTLRVRTAPDERAPACGEVWLADYGPLPCALPKGHDGLHRCYGSQGPIDFGPARAALSPLPTPHPPEPTP